MKEKWKKFLIKYGIPYHVAYLVGAIVGIWIIAKLTGRI